jgi:hypothetical protein
MEGQSCFRSSISATLMDATTPVLGAWLYFMGVQGGGVPKTKQLNLRCAGPTPGLVIGYRGVNNEIY